MAMRDHAAGVTGCPNNLVSKDERKGAKEGPAIEIHPQLRNR